jgi:pyridoxal phosphate enzyme (YggS family)
MQTIIENYSVLVDKIETVARFSGRKSSDICLVAATKGQGPHVIQALIDYLNSQGIGAILGESRVQEWVKKKALLRGNFQVHYIGRLQSNKAGEAVASFALIHSVHSEKLAHAVNDAARRAGKIQDILLQVNISDDPDKAGFSQAEVAAFVAGALPELKSLRCRGLMTITRQYENPADAQNDYRSMRLFAAELLGNSYNSFALDGGRPLLSMGMSADFEYAIAEGATHIRIGAALFGVRD